METDTVQTEKTKSRSALTAAAPVLSIGAAIVLVHKSP